MASTPDPFLASCWNLDNSASRRMYQDFCRAFALELQAQPRDEPGKEDLNGNVNRFIALLHEDSNSPFTFWSVADMVMGDVLNIRSDKLGQLGGA